MHNKSILFIIVLLRNPKEKDAKIWVLNQGGNKSIFIKAWDDDNFEMPDSNIKVRFLKLIEEIHNGDKIEFREAWIITTDKFASAETLWKIMLFTN